EPSSASPAETRANAEEPEPSSAAASRERSFTLGSSRDDVLAAQGTPSAMDMSHGETWSYGASTVRFRKGKVIEWSATTTSPLRVTLQPKDVKAFLEARRRGAFAPG